MAANKEFGLDFIIGSKIASSFSSGLGKAKSSIEGLNKTLNANKDAIQATGKAMMALSGATLAGLGIAANEAIKFESAMADVKKVVDFDSPAQFKEMSDDVLRLSTELPMVATDIAKIFALGGQSGIAKNELASFAESAVKMGVAFDITAEESGQAMAEMRTAFKMNQAEVVELADKINYLGNNTPAAAKGIMEIVQRIGPLGEVGGFASGSIAALGATIRGMGVQEEIAATGIKNMMLALVAGESATKSQKAAYASLGLESTSVAKAMQKDSEKTTLTVLKAVSKLDKYKQAATLKELFGSESLGSIAPLLTNMGALEKNLNMVGDASKYAGSMEKEYAARAATTENAIQLAKNQVNVLAITIGTQLLPTINKMLTAFSGVMKGVQKWASENPELVASLSKIGVVVALIVGGLGAFAVSAWALAAPIGMAITLIKGIGLAIAFVGRLFLMNPIGLAITAIIAVIGLLYYNWDTVTKFMGSALESVSAVVSGVWSSIKGFFTSGIANISATIINWSPIGLFYQAFSAVLSWFGVDLPAKFTGFGSMIIQGLINGISSMAGAVIEKAKSIASAITNTVKGAFDINSPSKVFAQIGTWNMEGLANGMTAATPVANQAASSAVSGVVPSVTQAQAASGIGGGSGSGTTIQLTQYITAGSSDAYNQAKEGAAAGVENFADEFNKMMANKARLAF